MKIFENFFLESKKLEYFNKNKLFFKINRIFREPDSHQTDAN
jgi:hypothetical protein